MNLVTLGKGGVDTTTPLARAAPRREHVVREQLSAAPDGTVRPVAGAVVVVVVVVEQRAGLSRQEGLVGQGGACSSSTGAAPFRRGALVQKAFFATLKFTRLLQPPS